MTATMRERAVELGEGWDSRSSGLLVPPPRRPARDRPVGVGLFAGAGGFDLGFTQAGFHMAAAVETWDVAAATYLCNLGGPDTVVHGPDGIIPNGNSPFGTGWIASAGHTACPNHPHDPDNPPNGGLGCMSCGWRIDGCTCAPCVDPLPCEHFWLDDIRNVRGADILSALGMKQGEVEVVIGGPPCQGYSASGKRQIMDPRNSLVFEFARLVLEIQPNTFVMENVPGILTMITPEGLPVLDALSRQLAGGGYGDYAALKRALTQQAQALVGTPWTPNSTRPAKAERPSGDDQPDLFEVTAQEAAERAATPTTSGRSS